MLVVIWRRLEASVSLKEAQDNQIKSLTSEILNC